MSGDLAGAVHAPGKHRTRQARPLKAGDSTVQAVLRPLGGLGVILGGGGEQVDVAEAVVTAVQPVGPVQQGLHLAGHLVVVDGGGKDDHVGIVHLLHDVVAVILDDALWQARQP